MKNYQHLNSGFWLTWRFRMSIYISSYRIPTIFLHHIHIKSQWKQQEKQTEPLTRNNFIYFCSGEKSISSICPDWRETDKKKPQLFTFSPWLPMVTVRHSGADCLTSKQQKSCTRAVQPVNYWHVCWTTKSVTGQRLARLFWSSGAAFICVPKLMLLWELTCIINP